MQNLTLKPHARITVCLALLFIWPTAQAQTTYQFTRIDNDSMSIASGGPPSVSDSGRVAFSASVPGRGSGIFSGTGQEQELNDYLAIATNQPGFFPGDPGSYVGSRVAFWAQLGTGHETDGCFSSDGFVRQTIVVDPTIQRNMSNPWMNRAGQVAYHGGTGDPVPGGRPGFYVGHNGSSKPVYTVPATSTIGAMEMHFVGETLGIDDAGKILFTGSFFSTPKTTDLDGLLQGDLSGRLPSTVVEYSSFGLIDMRLSAANNSGQVVFVANVFVNHVSHPNLFKVSGGKITTLVDTAAGPAAAILVIAQVAINDAGQVVYVANYKNAAGQFQAGLFTGPDLVNDKIIGSGDVLLNSIVLGISFQRAGLNSAGQVAFNVVYSDGKSAIIRADPVGSGTTVEWVTGSGGSFDTTSNWHPTNGDPPRVPEKTAILDDTALFPGCGTYTVEVGNERVDRLFVTCGNLTLHNGSFTAASLSDIPPSVEINNASLTLAGSALKSSHAWIGHSQAGRVTIQAGSSWQSQGRIEVGKQGDGTLEIHDLVGSAESRIGNGTGQGKVVVDGPSALWTAGNLAVGYDGTGTLTLTNEAKVFSDSAFIGLLSGSSGDVNLDGASGGPAKSVQWNLGAAPDLVVGQAGSGGIFVHNAAGIAGSNANLAIGASPSGFGVVRVFSDPGDPNDPDRYGHAATLGMKVITVGQGGNGFLTVGPNALCAFVSGLFVGDEGRGVVVVDGANGTFPSDFAQLGGTGFVSIGDSSGRGEMEIRNGGLVSGSFASMGLNSRRGSGYVIIDGADSRWDVGTDLDMGQNGSGTVELQNGGTLNVAGTVYLQSHGEIKGNGTVHAGRRVENGGTISPGLSPGRLVLEGDYQQTVKGRLKIEVGGPDPGVSHDQFVVHGAATLNGTLELRFINGFAPKQGDTFNFLLVSNNLNNSFSAVEVKNLTPDFQFQIRTNGTNISLAAMNDGLFVTPLQGRISSSNVVTVGSISYLPYTINATEDCSLVEPTGAVTRQDQELFQTLSERRDPDCQEGVARVSRALPLGALPPGSYHFHFMCDGVVVHTVSFDVLADTSQLLTFSRTAGGELALRINGLDLVQYTIQTSKDLKDWFDLSAHVGTFLGPYTVFEPFSASKGRFYRVKIE